MSVKAYRELLSALIGFLKDQGELSDSLPVEGSSLPRLRTFAALSAQQSRKAPAPARAPLQQRKAEAQSPKQAPKAASAKEARQDGACKGGQFTLEHADAAAPAEDGAIRDVLVACGLKLLSKPPDDGLARALTVTCPIALFALSDPVLHVALLRSLARAISVVLAPARLIELEQTPKVNALEEIKGLHPRLLIATPAAASPVKELGIPLLVVDQLREVIHKPQLKAALWQKVTSAWARHG